MKPNVFDAFIIGTTIGVLIGKLYHRKRLWK